jgi:signal transduction histidine kinase
VRLLQNPIVLKAALTFLLICVFALLGMILIRRARKQITQSDPQPRIDAQHAGFSLAAYEGVITRLKEQERELDRLRRSESDRAKESATVSEAIISNLASGVVLFNTNGLVRQANPAARALLGFASPSSMHARGIFKTVTSVRFAEGGVQADDPANALVNAIERGISEGALFRRIEANYTTPAGQSRVLGITISPVRLASGDRLGAVCLLTDLTDITRMSEQLRLNENMAALGEMSAGIAHEFKNSLATISGYAQMLAAESNGTSDFAQRIVTETGNLSRIVSDFLKFARPQGVDKEQIELLPLVEESARENNVRLSIARSGDDFRINADRTALKQAISNLFRNSSEAAGESAQMFATINATPESVNVQLTDNGGGIAPENLQKIFIPFFTTKAKGTGLGLALVHRIITEQGGAISVSSPVTLPSGDLGTTFTLTLPRGTSSKSAAEASISQG